MNTLQKLANWKFILPLILLYLLIALVLFPRYQKQIDTIAGQHVIPLDLRISYTPADVEEGHGGHDAVAPGRRREHLHLPQLQALRDQQA